MSIAQYALSFCGIVRLPSLAGLEDDPRRLVVGLHRPTVQKDWTDFSAARGKSYVSVARRRDRQPPTRHLRVAQRMKLSTVVEIRHFRRSEEHTSELQSLMRISYAVYCLKKKHKRKH